MDQEHLANQDDGQDQGVNRDECEARRHDQVGQGDGNQIARDQ